MAYCKAKGVLVAPEWKSASFWPLICDNSCDFSAFVKDVLFLPTNKDSYTPCRNGVGIFGTENLRFRMIAFFFEF